MQKLKLQLKRELAKQQVKGNDITISQVVINCFHNGRFRNNYTKIHYWCRVGIKQYDVKLLERIAKYIGCRPTDLII